MIYNSMTSFIALLGHLYCINMLYLYINVLSCIDITNRLVRYGLFYYNINILFKGTPFIFLKKDSYYSRIGLLIVTYGTYLWPHCKEKQTSIVYVIFSW